MALIFFIAFSTVTAIFGNKITPPKSVRAISYKISLPNNEIKFKNDTSGEELVYSPNTTASGGFTLELNQYNIGASFKQAISEDEKKRGKELSRYNDYFVRGSYKEGIFHLFYNEYSGYKLGNIESNDLLDINSKQYGISYQYFLKDNFNLKKHYGFYSLKKKSDYSFYLLGAYSKFNLSSKNSLIPSEEESNFEEYKNLKGFEQDSLSLIWGATGQYVHSFYFIQASFGIGLNIAQSRYVGLESNNDLKSGLSNHIQTNFGHEFKTSILGFELNAIQISETKDENTFSSTIFDVHLYYKYFF